MVLIFLFLCLFFCFFFQAEDGIRDWSVTGVQTCALPISFSVVALAREAKEQIVSDFRAHDSDTGSPPVQIALLSRRSEERRVGKECRSRWSTSNQKTTRRKNQVYSKNGQLTTFTNKRLTR